MSPGKCPHLGEREHKSHRARAQEAGTGTGEEKESSRKTGEEGEIQKKFQSVIYHVGSTAERRKEGLARNEARNEARNKARNEVLSAAMAKVPQRPFPGSTGHEGIRDPGR